MCRRVSSQLKLKVVTLVRHVIYHLPTPRVLGLCQPYKSTEPAYPRYLNIKQQQHNLFEVLRVRKLSCLIFVNTMKTSPRNKSPPKRSERIVQNEFSFLLEWTCTAPSWSQEAGWNTQQEQCSGSLKKWGPKQAIGHDWWCRFIKLLLSLLMWQLQ